MNLRMLRTAWLVMLGSVYTQATPYPTALDLPDDMVVRGSLDRLSTRSGVALPRQGWPLTAREVQDYLRQILTQDSTALTSSDSVLLRDYLEWPRELKRWVNEASGTQLALNVRTGGNVVSDDSSGAHHTQMGWVGGRVYGVVGNELWFYSDARIFTQWSNRYEFYDFYALADAETSGVPFEEASTNGRYAKRTGARYTAWMQWSRNWITLKYGRDRIQHGPGEWTGLTTTWTTPPYQMLDARIFPFPWLSVQSSTLELRQAGLQGGLYFNGDTRKWMHVHRFELNLLDGLALAFQNQVLYRDSGGVNPGYILPLVPIFFSQDLNGNRDNAMMQFDGTWSSRWGTKVWGAFLIDDLNSIGDIAGNHWLNRWAALAGGQILSPWKKVDGDLTLEFSQVRPWTYTGGREEAYSFAHYGLPTGSELGPDSRTFHGRFAWRPSARWVLGAEVAQLEKGIGPQATLGTVNGHWGGFYNQGATLSYGKIIHRSIGIELQSLLWRNAVASLELTRYSQESEGASTIKWWKLNTIGVIDW